jgi:DNA helicase-2/ATP-dependent DNA helicase PcrA
LTTSRRIRSVADLVVDLSKLNPPQREAAGHQGGPLLVLAGAGSGKTRVITFRITHLLSLGVPPSAICAVTFTNKAAEEMRERVAHLLQDAKTARELTMGTFHALGLSILRTERKALGLPRGFAIYDQSDQMGVLREAMRAVREIGRDGERRFDAKAVMSRISLAKNSFVSAEEYRPLNPADEYDNITAEVYPRYQEMLRACAAFDFDDLIVEPVRLFEKHADVARRWATKFRFVMVDEYQDTNRAQLRLVQHLVADHHNLLVVGDDDQSIYSWRGADPSHILGFAEAFPGARVVKLEQNYRSTKTILDAANAVIANNTVRHGKTLWSQHAMGEPIVHAVAPTPEVEAQWIAREIRALQKDGRRYQDIAIMYRSNIQAKALEEELRANDVPYKMYGGQQFFERKEVKDLIAYLRVALNPRDELGLRRVLNYPARGIGGTTVEKLVASAHAKHATLWDALRAVASPQRSLGDAPPPPLELVSPGGDPDAEPFADGGHGAVHGHLDPGDIRGGTRTAIAGFVDAVTRLGVALTSGVEVVTATRSLMDQIGLYDDLKMAAGSMSAAQRRIDNVEGLLKSLARFAEKPDKKGKGTDALAGYLRALSLDTSSNDEEDLGDKVVMTTLHGAKGLEFPVCFMVGLEEELLPHARTLNPQATDVNDPDHATDVSEERRLCYVGITRAQQKLYITRACTRVSRGREVPRTPSRFLLEIPDELLEVRDLGEEARQPVPNTEVRNFFASLALDD